MVIKQPSKTLGIAALLIVSSLVTLARAAPPGPTAGPAPSASASATIPVASAAPVASSAPSVAVPPAPPETKVFHAPVITWHSGEALTLRANIDRADRSKRVLVVYDANGERKQLAFERSAAEFAVTIPAPEVHGPRLAYAIEVEELDGHMRPVFATPEDMHEVHVMADITDTREQVLLDRVEHRRNVLTASGEYAYFGSGVANLMVNGQPETRRVDDAYWRAEASYTYRILGIASEFGIRFGLVRGSSVVPGQTDPEKLKVGLNYGAPRIRLRVVDWLHVDGELLASVTEIGFSVGGGGAILIGDPYGAKLTLGGEGIQIFGGRGYARLDVPAGKRVIIAPMVEVTNMPHASSAGVRLIVDVTFKLGNGVGLVARAGYMARDFTDVGVGGGLSASYAF